jgi:hypothetical protein
MDIAQKLNGKFIDEASLEPVAEDGGCFVEFFMEAAPDPLLTDGGMLDRRHPKVKEIQKMEQDALMAARAEQPFSEPEPTAPAKDAPGAAQVAYRQAREDWERRAKEHDEGLRAQTALLRDHHEIKEVFVVTPAGRPIYVDREYIRKMIPGDRENEVVRPVRPEDIVAYRARYNQFKSGQTQAIAGTPLEQWPGLTKAQVRELAFFNVRSVEQLAQVSDANLSKIGTYTAIRKKAQDWLAAARGAAPVEEARAEARRATEEVAELRRQLAEIQKHQNQGGNQNQRR